MLHIHHHGLMSRPRKLAAREQAITDIVENCVLTRTRVISRLLTNIYDDAYRSLGINSSQVILLTIIYKIGPASRAEIGRFNRQERSTLTRNLEIMLEAGWIEEADQQQKGRARPIVITESGIQILMDGYPAWQSAQKQAIAALGKSAVAAVMDAGSNLFPT